MYYLSDCVPLISVILPCFNAESLIDQAVQSILNQTLSCFELIVVDDASSDSTLKVVRAFQDSRIKVIQLQTNQGYPSAINVGISIAKGKYIARMDADDVCLPTRFEEQLKALHLYPKAAFCGVNRYRITPGNKFYCDRTLPVAKYIVETWEDLMNNQRLFTDPSVMVERQKVLEVGGYRTFQRSGMDVDLWLRLMERFGDCVTVTSPLYGKRLEPGSLIFNPRTALINQIPRVLAMQRKKSGRDVIDLGEQIEVETWLTRGWIKPFGLREKRSLIIGSAVICAFFLDGKGFKTYFYSAWKASVTLKEKFALLLEIISKLLRRIRHNPYKKFDIT
ncbi:MAG: glycosyltransferase family 2 protein [Flavobacteriales bacterium]|nr:glycosyltransferase family 2 protein [Flavobacteriales bacterium]